MDCSTPGFPILHYLPQFAQTHAHWISDAIQSFHPVVSFFSCPQSFLASEFFPVSWLFASDGQIIGASVSVSVLPVNIQSWFPLGLTGWISLLSEELPRVFSSTTVWKHQFFGAQCSLWSSSHICTWLLKNHAPFSAKRCLLFITLSRFFIGIISITEVGDISPGNLDSSLWFIQSSISHDVQCIEVKYLEWQYTALSYSFSNLESVCCSMSASNCCFLTCIQVSQETDKVVWYSHLLKSFSQLVVIHTVKDFSVVNEAFSAVQFSCSVVSDSLQPHESEHARPPCPSLTPGVHSDSRQ